MRLVDLVAVQQLVHARETAVALLEQVDAGKFEIRIGYMAVTDLTLIECAKLDLQVSLRRDLERAERGLTALGVTLA